MHERTSSRMVGVISVVVVWCNGSYLNASSFYFYHLGHRVVDVCGAKVSLQKHVTFERLGFSFLVINSTNRMLHVRPATVLDSWQELDTVNLSMHLHCHFLPAI